MVNPNKNKKRRKRRAQDDNGAEGQVAVKPAPQPLRIPVVEEEDLDDYEDDYEDDGGLYEDELVDAPIEATLESSNGVEGVDFVKATPQQEMAGKIFQERQARLNVMQKNANLEQEISVLRKEVAETRIQRLKDEAAIMKNQDALMFSDVGLNEGDQLKPTEDGFIIIPKK